MNIRDLARRGGETEELIAMRDAFQNGTPAERAEARRWFVKREARMAEMQRETRVATAPAELRYDEDAEQERILAEALAAVERSNRFDEEFGL